MVGVVGSAGVVGPAEPPHPAIRPHTVLTTHNDEILARDLELMTLFHSCNERPVPNSTASENRWQDSKSSLLSYAPLPLMAAATIALKPYLVPRQAVCEAHHFVVC